MTTTLSLIAILASFLIIKFREKVADLIGEADWMHKIGGVYNFVILCGVFSFLWGVAGLTGTLDILFGPVKKLIPGLNTVETGPEAI